MKLAILAAVAVTTSTGGLAQSAPERDSRGIAVISAPAAVPAGANAMPTVPAGAKVVVSPDQSSVFAPVAASGELLACSKTVTDRCKQTYERQGR
ncbi:MAG: hypothetical protein LH465_04370 [Sphingomonas bacterium]|nr:hypothetical protein [Sphingomonas bacterium]